MSTQHYNESRTYREENRRSNDAFDAPFNRGAQMPIHSSLGGPPLNSNHQLVQDRIRHQETSLQWVNDPISGTEKFRVTINIDGFNQNEVCQY